jgi:hypothetical protein
MFKGPETEIDLHVFSAGCSEIDRMLLFGNWLSSDAADRDLYARTKWFSLNFICPISAFITSPLGGDNPCGFLQS